MELEKYKKAQKIREEINRTKTSLDMLQDIMCGAKEYRTVVSSIQHGGTLRVEIPVDDVEPILKRVKMTLEGKMILLENKFKEL